MFFWHQDSKSHSQSTEMEKLEKNGVHFFPLLRRDGYKQLLSVDSLLDDSGCSYGSSLSTSSGSRHGKTSHKYELLRDADQTQRLPLKLEALSLSPKSTAKRKMHLIACKVPKASSTPAPLVIPSKQSTLSGGRSAVSERRYINLLKLNQHWSLDAANESYSNSNEKEEKTRSQPELLLKDQGVDNKAFDGRSLISISTTRPKHGNKDDRSLESSPPLEDVSSILKLLDEIKCKIQKISGDDLQSLNRLLKGRPTQKRLNQEIAHRLRTEHSGGKPILQVSVSSVLDLDASRRHQQHTMKENSTEKHGTLEDTSFSHTDSLSKSAPLSEDTEVNKEDNSILYLHSAVEGNSKSCSVDMENNKRANGAQFDTRLEPSHVTEVLNTTDKVSTPNQSDSIPMVELTNTSKSNSEEESGLKISVQSKHRMEITTVDGHQLKTITLYKDGEPLGATVRNEGDAVVIARVIKGGVAERTKFLKQGDELLKINDVNVRGKTIDEVAELMSALSGELRLVTKVSSAPQLGAISRCVPRRNITVRAQFDYDVVEDPFIPCMELGVSFHIGDILHVINRDDPHWWQAHREGDSNESLAGLIPSKLFWETREQVRRAILAETDENMKQKTSLSCCPAPGKQLRNKRKLSVKYEQCPTELDQLLTYEEVGAYHSLPNRKRPIVLVGCEELRLHKICERMVSLDKHRFVQPIRTSSRPSMFTSDKQSPLLQFLPHDKFIERIKNGEFIEYKVNDVPEMHYVGVSRKSVTEAINSGATCITYCQPKNITNLRNSDLKPYIVFIAAPPIKRLKDFLRTESTIEPTNDECKHIIDLSRYTESTYTYLYDYVLTLVNMEQACEELIAEVNRIDIHPQWVPIDWVPQIDGKTNSNYLASTAQRSSKVKSSIDHSPLEVISGPDAVDREEAGQQQSVVVDCHTQPAMNTQGHSSSCSTVGPKATSDVVDGDKWIENL